MIKLSWQRLEFVSNISNVLSISKIYFSKKKCFHYLFFCHNMYSLFNKINFVCCGITCFILKHLKLSTDCDKKGINRYEDSVICNYQNY